LYPPYSFLNIHQIRAHNAYSGSIKWFLRDVSTPFNRAANGGDVTCPPEHGSIPCPVDVFSGIGCEKMGSKSMETRYSMKGSLLAMYVQTFVLLLCVALMKVA
jgi:hypothetical protein